MVLDPSDPVIDESKYQRRDWTSSEFGHLPAHRQVPPNIPEPCGLGFIVTSKVDAYYAVATVIIMSMTGFLVHINSALIYWFSKKQTGVEKCSFGLEFTAMK